MRLSKQHKVYGAVLGLALAALAADRFVFTSAPAAAGTAEAYAVTNRVAAFPAKTVAPKQVPAKAAASAAVADDRRAISAKLDALAQVAGFSSGGSRDAFAPPEAWVKTSLFARGISDGERQAQERTHKFIADHRLTAVMDGSGRNAVAVIDGKPIRPGQTLDGFKLLSVSGRDVKATFESAGGGEVELRLSKTAVPAAAVAQAN